MGDHDGFVVERVVKVRQPSVGAWRRLIDLCRTFHLEGFVGTLIIEDPIAKSGTTLRRAHSLPVVVVSPRAVTVPGPHTAFLEICVPNHMGTDHFGPTSIALASPRETATSVVGLKEPTRS